MNGPVKQENAGEGARAPSKGEPLSEPNYHNMIGEEFIALRGSGFDLSAIDLELISKWHEMGVPLFIPLRVIADVKEYRELKRPVRTLGFITEEVEARFGELLEGHVGCGGCDQPYCAPRTAE